MLPINQRFTCSNSLTVKVLERHSTSPKDLWNQWREKNSHIPTASTLPCYFGCGYSSYNTALLTKSGIALPEKPGKSTNKGLSEIFVDKAKQWGVTNEPFARKIYEDIIAKKMLMNIRPYSVQNGDESTIIEISSGEDKVTTLVTPDMVVEYYKSCLTDEHRKRVVEFKCPFFCVLKNKHIKPILDICLDYVNTHPYGVPSAYIQACTYAIANDADKITLVYYFTDSVDSESLLEYNYARDREFDCLLLNGLLEFTEDLKKTKENGNLNKRARKKKLGVEYYMEMNLLATRIYDCTSPYSILKENIYYDKDICGTTDTVLEDKSTDKSE